MVRASEITPITRAVDYISCAVRPDNVEQVPVFYALQRHLATFSACPLVGHQRSCHDVPVGRGFDFPKGSLVVMDKGYTDYGWYKQLTEQGVFFVTRQRRNARYRVLERRQGDSAQGVTSDQVIELSGEKFKHGAMPPLRRVGYRDAQSGRHYVFLTNHFKLSARTIAEVYKARWQVELFFKAIKQNLKIHAFVGNSKNAVLTQIWVALCAYLLLSYLKFLSKTGWSAQRIIRLIQANLFAKRDLMALIRPVPPPTRTDPPQLPLWA
jgi:putative transposase